MQRVDDVTGEPIRVSATQRERQREEMVDQINALIRENNQHARLLRAQGGVIGDILTAHEALKAEVADFQGRTFWHRLRWLVTGR
jgi:flagellar hook-length control protein FliK